jgi:uncharacterized protein
VTAPRAILLLLAKAPQPGRVKTRLCPSVGPVQAARMAAAAFLDTLAALRAVPGGQPVVALTGDLAGAERHAEVSAALRGIPVIPQRGATLGQRIAACHADAADLLPGLASLQVGMDTPQIDASLLTRCLRRLDRPGTGAVLGPAVDGGWWALGLRDPRTAVAIAGVATSRADTGVRTAHALRHHGLAVSELPRLRDVDTITDAHAVAATIPDSRFAAAVRELP